MNGPPSIGLLFGMGFAELLVILIILGCIAFWVWMIVDCALKEESGGVRAAWIVVIAVLGIIGALIYLFVRRISRKQGKSGQPSEPAPGAGREMQ
jgi:formate hydrogenlyase subunit 3/multisubunit Na+/H+ antiporter MnhD subunit